MEIMINGVLLEIEFTYYPECRGHRDKYGAPEEPDEEAYIDIESVKLAEPACIMDLLSNATIKEIEEKIIEELNDREDDYYE